jgi:hypothetical protein
MAEIIKISTIERHLFGPDAIPWTQLRLPSNLQKLQERYKFAEVRQSADPSGNLVQLMGVGGEFTITEVPRAVEQFILEPNVIQFQIAVSSDESRKFFEDVTKFLIEIDPAKVLSSARERTTTYQTVATARLAIPADALFSEPLRQFLQGIVASKVKLPDADAEITLERLGWKISYKTQSTDYLYLPKRLTIEPRAGSNPSEMLYFTQSPTDFKTHGDLLEAFEKSFAETRHRSRPVSRSKS